MKEVWLPPSLQPPAISVAITMVTVWYTLPKHPSVIFFTSTLGRHSWASASCNLGLHATHGESCQAACPGGGADAQDIYLKWVIMQLSNFSRAVLVRTSLAEVL